MSSRSRDCVGSAVGVWVVCSGKARAQRNVREQPLWMKWTCTFLDCSPMQYALQKGALLRGGGDGQSLSSAADTHRQLPVNSQHSIATAVAAPKMTDKQQATASIRGCASSGSAVEPIPIPSQAQAAPARPDAASPAARAADPACWFPVSDSQTATSLTCCSTGAQERTRLADSKPAPPGPNCPPKPPVAALGPQPSNGQQREATRPDQQNVSLATGESALSVRTRD